MAAPDALMRVAEEARVAVPFAAALAGAVTLAARRGARWPAVWLIFQVPILLLLANPDWRMFSFHGMLHAGIVHEIAERGVPPQVPFLAGEALGYPWGGHALFAVAMRVVPLSVPWLFALLDVGCLAAFAWAADRFAALLSADRSFRALAVALSMTGFAFATIAPAGVVAGRLGIAWPLDDRGDVAHKFMTANFNQAGLALFAAAMAGAGGMVARREARGADLALAAGAFLACAYVYPSNWLCIGMVLAAGWILLLVPRGDSRSIRAAGLAAAGFGGAALLALPWLQSFSDAGAARGIFRPVDPTTVGRNALGILAIAASCAPIVFAGRTALRSTIAERPRVAAFCALATLPLATAYLLALFGQENVDKFLLCAAVPVGALLAVPLKAVLDRAPLAAFGFVALCALGFSWKTAPRLFDPPRAADPLRSDGATLVHRFAAHDELYRWIAAQTSADAVFVDTHMTIPVLGRRPLAVPTALRARTGELRGRLDGWSNSTENLLAYGAGSDPAKLAARRQAAESILSPAGPPPDAAIQSLRADFPDRPLYLLARDRGTQERLAECALLEAVFENTAGRVLRVR